MERVFSGPTGDPAENALEREVEHTFAQKLKVAQSKTSHDSGLMHLSVLFSFLFLFFSFFFFSLFLIFPLRVHSNNLTLGWVVLEQQVKEKPERTSEELTKKRRKRRKKNNNFISSCVFFLSTGLFNTFDIVGNRPYAGPCGPGRGRPYRAGNNQPWMNIAQAQKIRQANQVIFFFIIIFHYYYY